MEIHSTTNIVGWYNDRLRFENRTTYKYDEGNTVVVIDRRDVGYTLYSKIGEIESPSNKGQNIDTKA
jgi:hypothetical protein